MDKLFQKICDAAQEARESDETRFEKMRDKVLKERNSPDRNKNNERVLSAFLRSHSTQKNITDEEVKDLLARATESAARGSSGENQKDGVPEAGLYGTFVNKTIHGGYWKATEVSKFIQNAEELKQKQKAKEDAEYTVGFNKLLVLYNKVCAELVRTCVVDCKMTDGQVKAKFKNIGCPMPKNVLSSMQHYGKSSRFGKKF